MKTINDITEIDTDRNEGKLLVTAMALLTTDKKPFEDVLDNLNELSDNMFAE